VLRWEDGNAFKGGRGECEKSHRASFLSLHDINLNFCARHSTLLTFHHHFISIRNIMPVMELQARRLKEWSIKNMQIIIPPMDGDEHFGREPKGHFHLPCECWMGHTRIITVAHIYAGGYARMSNFSWIIYSRPLSHSHLIAWSAEALFMCKLFQNFIMMNDVCIIQMHILSREKQIHTRSPFSFWSDNVTMEGFSIEIC
jgi:hypothetical protein